MLWITKRGLTKAVSLNSPVERLKEVPKTGLFSQGLPTDKCWVSLKRDEPGGLNNTLFGNADNFKEFGLLASSFHLIFTFETGFYNATLTGLDSSK